MEVDYPNLNCFNWFQISLSIAAKKVSDLERRKRKVGEQKVIQDCQCEVKWRTIWSEIPKRDLSVEGKYKSYKKEKLLVLEDRRFLVGKERKKERSISESLQWGLSQA